MKQGELLALAISVLEGLGIPYMVVGSITSGAYGEPRLTLDIDIVVDLTAANVDDLCSAFPPERFYVSREAARAAMVQRGQFNVIDPESGNKIDFMIAPAGDWGREQLKRRQRIPLLPDLNAYAATPEDIIISKMRYYLEGRSDKHLRDIAGILNTSGECVDRPYVSEWAVRLGLEEIWRAVQERAAESAGWQAGSDWE